MKNVKFIISLVLAGVIFFAPAAAVFADPERADAHPIAGTVTFVEVVSDVNTAVTTVLVTVEDDMGRSQTVRISLEMAINLGVVYNDGEQVVIVEPLSEYIEIELEEEPQHLFGSALATFFSDLDGVDYEAIVEAHESGHDFGDIAQVLWLTRKLIRAEPEEEASEIPSARAIFQTILDAKKTGNYTDFFPGVESAPSNWGQFRKAILRGEATGRPWTCHLAQC